MSKIYQPPGAPFDFQYIDGVANALQRSDVGGTTSGTGVVNLITIPIPPNAFDLNGKSLITRCYGNIQNTAGGNKTLFVVIDATSIWSLAMGALAGSNFMIEIFTMRRVNGFLQTRVNQETNLFSGTGSVPTLNARSDLIGGGTFDFSIAHSIIVQGQVSNAADAIQLDCHFTTML